MRLFRLCKNKNKTHFLSKILKMPDGINSGDGMNGGTSIMTTEKRKSINGCHYPAGLYVSTQLETIRDKLEENYYAEFITN